MQEEFWGTYGNAGLLLERHVEMVPGGLGAVLGSIVGCMLGGAVLGSILGCMFWGWRTGEHLRVHVGGGA